MEIKVGNEVRKVSEVCEKVVKGVFVKSGICMSVVVNVVYYMSCVKDGEGGWDIEWDWCELEVDECVKYEKWVMEVCEELDVELEM